MNQTPIFVSEELIQAASKATDLTSQNEVVEFALRELIRRSAQLRILELEGTVRWEGNLNQMRQGRTFDDPR